MAELVTVTASFVLKPEFVEVFGGTITEALKETSTWPGFYDIRLVQHLDNPNKVLLVERWETADQYKAYLAWRIETGMIDQINAVSTEPAQFDIWPTVITTAVKP